MSTAVIGCTVLIDGEAISDGCSLLHPDAPAVLSGLRVQWGRSSSVDQATASTCSFAVSDPLEGDRLVPALTIGRRVDVQADTVVYPDPDVSTIPYLLPGPTSNATVTGAGTTSNVIYAGSEYRAATVTYPPRAYSSDPTAWDDVPRALPGQAWSLSATLSGPAPFAGWQGWQAVVTPVAFTSPAGPGLLLADNVTLSPSAPSGTLVFTPPAGVWLGLQIAIYPPGPRWVDLDGTAWADLGPAPTWQDLATFTLTDVDMLAPAEGAASSGLVFSGRITDVSVQWDGDRSVRVSVIAQDWLAELANRFVGDTPWPLEALVQRAERVVALSGQPTTITVDPGVQGLQVTYRDVDRQPAATLLQQLATSAAGILWTATHLVTGQTIWLEDVAARPAARTLTDAGGLVHVIASAGAIAHSLPISSCDLDAEPVRFNLDMSDTVSTVALTWKEQVVDDGVVKPADRTIDATDTGIEAVIGARRLSISTQLSYQPQAAAAAQLWLARSSILAWRMEGLRWDTSLLPGLSPTEIETVMTLLNGISRIGLPIAITEVPEWAWPVAGGADTVALYVEGGTYVYNAGAWVLELDTSSATGSAVGNFPWTNSDADWRWVDYDPGLSWLELFGVTYPDL